MGPFFVHLLQLFTTDFLEDNHEDSAVHKIAVNLVSSEMREKEIYGCIVRILKIRIFPSSHAN